MARLLADSAGITRGPLDLQRLEARYPVEQVALLRLWLQVNDLPEAGDAALEEFAGQVVGASSGHQPELRLDGGALRRYRDQVHFVPTIVPAQTERALSVPDTVSLPQGVLVVTAARGGPRPRGVLELRCYGAPGATGSGLAITSGGRDRAVRELLRAAGVPPWQRPGYPLLYDDAGLLAIPGIAVRDGAAGEEDGIACSWRPSGPAGWADR